MGDVPNPDRAIVTDSADSFSVGTPSNPKENSFVTSQALFYWSLDRSLVVDLPKQGMTKDCPACEPEILQCVVVESAAKDCAMLLGLD